MEIYILTSLHPGIPLTRDPIHNSAMTLFLNLEKEGVGGDSVFTLKWAPS